MTTADDLLRRALEVLDRFYDVDLRSDIRAYLDAPKDDFCDGNCTWLDHHPDCVYAVKDEPVAWQSLTDDEVWEISKLNGDDYEYFCALEAKLKEKNHPPTKTAPMKPMTEEEISDVLNVDPQWFMDGLNWKALDLLQYAKAIEKFHGIGGGDE